MDSVIPQRPEALPFRIVKFNGTDEALWNLFDFVVVDTTARHVPDIDQEKAIRLIGPLDNGAASVDRIHVAERHDLQDDGGAVIGRIAAEFDECFLHARDVGNQFSRARMTDVLRQSGRNLDVTRPKRFRDRKNPATIRVGDLAALTVEIPIHEEFELKIFDAIGGEDTLHFGMADLRRSGIDVIRNHSDTLPSSTGDGFYPVPKRKRTDLARPKRIDVAGQCEVGSDQLDVVCGHGFLPWLSRDE